MKKTTKILTLILALLMIGLCLGGCDELDEMRKVQAFWTNEGSHDSITYDGVEYKKIDKTFILPDTSYNYSASTIITVTEKDVPVLLSDSFGDYMDMCESKNFIQGYVSPVATDLNSLYSPYDYGSDALFCKADIYDEIIEKIESGIEYTKYGYSYSYYVEEDDEYTEGFYYLSDEEIDAINKTLSEVEPATDSDAAYDYSYLTSLVAISDDLYFGKDSYEIYTSGINYYLVHYSPSLDSYTSYKVPSELSDIFDNMTEYAQKEYEYYYY